MVAQLVIGAACSIEGRLRVKKKNHGIFSGHEHFSVYIVTIPPTALKPQQLID